MNRRRQLVALVLVPLALTSLASHLTIGFLGIETSPRFREPIGRPGGSNTICAAGSSLTFYGLDWDKIAAVTDRPVTKCGVPAASPCELELIYETVPNPDITVVGISVYDLNEYFLSDFRSEVVPLKAAIRDLGASGADWPFTKRVVSQYLLSWLRILFPTAGRSTGVMVGMRAKARGLLGKARSGSETGPSLNALSPAAARIEDWPPGRMWRNLASTRASCQGRIGFGGPKRLALKRLLSRAVQRGRAVVVVLPVSPPYYNEFIDEDVSLLFENLLAELKRSTSEILWVRLDLVSELHSTRYYWDLVHLNVEGQAIATEIMIHRLKELAVIR